MKNSDEAIDKVLAGLRETVPTEGLERRVQAAVHQRAAAPRGLPLGWAAVGGFTLLAATVLALLGFPRLSTAPPAIQAIVHPQAQPLPMASGFAVPSTGPAAAGPRCHTLTVRAQPRVPILPVLAASFPAPAMPLTEQERLLLEVARRGEPTAVPVLDPDALARQETHSEQVFEAVLEAAEEPSILNQKEDK